MFFGKEHLNLSELFWIISGDMYGFLQQFVQQLAESQSLIFEGMNNQDLASVMERLDVYKRQLSIFELECQCLFQKLGESYEVNQLMAWYAQNNPQWRGFIIDADNWIGAMSSSDIGIQEMGQQYVVLNKSSYVQERSTGSRSSRRSGSSIKSQIAQLRTDLAIEQRTQIEAQKLQEMKVALLKQQEEVRLAEEKLKANRKRIFLEELEAQEKKA